MHSPLTVVALGLALPSYSWLLVADRQAWRDALNGLASGQPLRGVLSGP
jgi:hypothetical protein